MYEDGIISNKLVKDLINEIEGYKEFISDKAILIDKNLKEVKKIKIGLLSIFVLDGWVVPALLKH